MDSARPAIGTTASWTEASSSRRYPITRAGRISRTDTCDTPPKSQAVQLESGLVSEHLAIANSCASITTGLSAHLTLGHLEISCHSVSNLSVDQARQRPRWRGSAAGGVVRAAAGCRLSSCASRHDGLHTSPTSQASSISSSLPLSDLM